MTIKYNYKCSSCEKTYSEQRTAEENQFFVTCQACLNGTYEEISVEVISEIVERASAPETVEELAIEKPTE